MEPRTLDLGVTPGKTLRIGADAAHVLLAAAEELLLQAFRDSNFMVTSLTKRSTLFPEDLAVWRELCLEPWQRNFEFNPGFNPTEKRKAPAEGGSKKKRQTKSVQGFE